MNREIFTNELLNALEHSKKASVDESIILRMEDQALMNIFSKEKFSKKSLLGIAASLLILISLNAASLGYFQNTISSVELESTEPYVFNPAKSIYNE